jgi:hypothetical protein
MGKAAMRKKLTPEEAAKLRSEWNIYEWDKPEQYEYVKALKRDRLRWEFLRRDEGYHAKYAQYSKTEAHPVLGKYINPKKRGDELAEDFCFLDTGRRGGPLVLRAPSAKTLLFKRDEISADNKILEHYGRALQEFHELGYVIMVFDPARTPTSQVRAASKIIKARHDDYVEQYPNHVIKGKRTPKDAPKLLRALDAALVGINNQTIAADIFGTKEYKSQLTVGKERLESAQNYWRVM